MKKSVNIVAIKDNWILQRIVEQLVDRLPYLEWTESPICKHKLTYFVNYAQVTPEKVSDIELALFTHIEEGSVEKVNKWNDAAGKVDVAICMSKMYRKKINNFQNKAVVISPGVDINKFKQRPLIIGIVGRTAKSNRKGEEIIKKVANIPGVEWRLTGVGWPMPSRVIGDKQMPDFYRGLDYLLVAGTIEGGPMPALEALACGVPVISSEVGWMPELPHIKFKNGDADDLRRVIERLVLQRSELRDSILDRTWDSFSEKHDILFQELLEVKMDNKKRHIASIIKKFNRRAA